ncbi:restriction endonuclease subunit S [Enterococcus gallinarum]|uniref:restriction endonuclease subunit S n=1 Tax=Enterococcus gallinarum TaxID=1353 RepID=UPI0028904F49|nr:restriction endonuclease subunit S [Enterococcus gallinarum]MDT2681336.1 restriction endonuclease subunit S [Enterococcus gallinarum]
MSNDTQPEIRFPGFTEDWEERKFADFIDVKSGKDYKHLNSGPIPVYGTGGYMLSVDRALSDIDAIGIGRKGTIDKPYLLKAPFWTVDTLFYAVPKQNIDLQFSLSIFKKINWKKFDESTGVPSLSKTVINSVGASVPCYEEQQKIGSFFKQLDKTIALHQRKLDLLKETKKGFLQKMFPKNGAKVPEIRFPGFTEDWEERKLVDIFKKDTQKNKDLEFHSDSVISVAKMKLSPPSAKSSDEYMKTYNKIRKGNVAFEGHTNDEFPNGRFVLNDCQDGIVSHIYDVYSAVDEYNNEFMKRYINNPDVMRKILINATSSARMMKSLNSIEFLKQSILLPILSEQQKIGKFFYQLDNTITLHQRKLDLLKETKKGFLQKMFV